MEAAIAITSLAGLTVAWRIRVIGRSAIYAWIEKWAERKKRAWLAWEEEMSK